MKPWKVRETYLGEIVMPPTSGFKGMRLNPQKEQELAQARVKLKHKQRLALEENRQRHAITYDF